MKRLYKKTFSIIGGVVVVLVLCEVIAVTWLNRTILLQSDFNGIEYEMEGTRITCISVKGEFPYSRVLCPHEKESVRDAGGNIVEFIDTYTMTADLSLLGRSAVSMKLDIETSDDVTYTYILKFSDGDMKIVNGKVVAAP